MYWFCGRREWSHRHQMISFYDGQNSDISLFTIHTFLWIVNWYFFLRGNHTLAQKNPAQKSSPFIIYKWQHSWSQSPTHSHRFSQLSFLCSPLHFLFVRGNHTPHKKVVPSVCLFTDTPTYEFFFLYSLFFF